MRESSYPGHRIIQKQDHLSAGMPFISLFDMYDRDIYLYKQAEAYSPLHLTIKSLFNKSGTSKIALERAVVVPFEIGDTKFSMFSENGDVARLFKGEGITYTSSPMGSLLWLSTGFTIVGKTGMVSGNKITFPAGESFQKFTVLASPDSLRAPVWRIRRVYATAVTDEIAENTSSADITCDGTTKDFEIQLENKPICPASVKMVVTIGGDDFTLVDSGKGFICNTPPEIVTADLGECTINYSTGRISLHLKTAPDNTTNILVSYEHGATDNSFYDVSWDKESF